MRVSAFQMVLVLLGTGGIQQFHHAASAQDQGLDPEEALVLQPGETLVLEGELTDADVAMDDGTRYDEYHVEMPAGVCSIELRSTEFDAYLIVGGKHDEIGDWQADDDDGGWTATNARLEGRLEKAQSIRIIANALRAEEHGLYELHVASYPNDERPIVPFYALASLKTMEAETGAIRRDYLCGEVESLDEAISIAQQIVALRKAHQSRDENGMAESGEWWQLVDARNRVAHLEQLSELPAESLAALLEADEEQTAGKASHRAQKYEESQAHFKRALTIREDILGPNHTDTVRSLNNLAFLLQAMGDYDAARPLNERALVIREDVLGPNHPDTATSLNNQAYLLKAMGDYEAARSMYERALAIYEAVLGPNHTDTATSVNNLAYLLHTMGDYEAARPMYERALAIREEFLGPNHTDTAMSLNNLALLLQAMGDYEAARSMYERALAIDEAVRGPNHTDTATSLNNLAGLLKAMGDYEAARSMYERALAIYEAVLGPNHTDTATSVNNLAHLLGAMGDYETARPMYERALAIREDALGPNHTDTAMSLNNLATVLHTMGDYEAARPMYERALAIREEFLGPNHTDTAMILNNLAVLLMDMGDYETAQPLHERALAIREDALGPNHTDTAMSLNNVATVLDTMGDYEAARPMYERALAINEDAWGPNHTDTAMSLNNVAHLLGAMGDYEAARPLYERALAIREDALGPNHTDTATSLNNLAHLLWAMGDYEAARPMYERALAIREDALGPNHTDTAMSLNNVAHLLGAMGDYEAARPMYERALAIYEAVLGPNHADTATSVNNLAGLLWAMGDYEAARPLYERALAIYEAVRGPNHADTARVKSNIAVMRLDLHQPDQAMNLIRQDTALDSPATSFLNTTMRSLSARERHSFAQSQQWHLEITLSVARAVKQQDGWRAHEDDELTDEGTLFAYDRLRLWKGQIGRLSRGQRQGLMQDVNPETIALVEELQVVQRKISRLFFKSSREQRENELPELIEKRQKLELALNRSIKSSGVLPDITFATFAESIPANAAVVDFFIHPIYEPAHWENGEVVEQGHWSTDRVSCWITRAGDDAPIWLDLGPAADMERAVQGFLTDLVATRGVDLDEPPVVDDLCAMLWDPVAPHLEDVDRLIVSPDQFLATLPLETIQLENGEYLLERYAITYLQDLNMLQQMEDANRPRYDSLLAVGGVDFDQRAALPALGESDEERAGARRAPISPVVRLNELNPADGDRGNGFELGWTPLGKTDDEVLGIERQHRRSVPDGSRVILMEQEPSEERLKQEFENHSVLHVATHGFFEPQGLSSMRETIRMPSGERMTRLGDTDRQVVGYHPGLLSGLVCAGANLPLEKGRDDGYLTAEEIGWLDLTNADLVVLSACSTGLGRARSGEGLMGLRREFINAGTRTVISSLWEVNDSSTSELMRQFYANLLEDDGMSVHEALRQAQLKMLNEQGGRPRPSQWGAFVLDGDWR